MAGSTGALLPVLLALLTSSASQASQLTNRLFEWTRHPEDYISEGKVLTGHLLVDYNHKYVSSQCALECLRQHRCKSFNFDRISGRCELNNASHVEFPADWTNNQTFEYHTREALSIDQEALGPCAANPCNDRGQCLETKNVQSDLIALCLCNPGWTGSGCQLKANTIDWGVWQEWSACSVTCHRGWRMRTRRCEDLTLEKSISTLECFGPDVEHEACVQQECPKWEEWGSWGDCSASRTCGFGTKTHIRTCSNGGTPGVDRYCMGSTNETTPCQGIDCQGAMRLRNGTSPGEGRLEVFNDVTTQWGQVCADQLTLPAAHLVCLQMGFPGAHAVVADGRFNGSSNSSLLALTAISCQGNERTLLQCQHNDWVLNGTCKAGQRIAAGLQCNVNGAWSLWSSWSDCSVTCENGTRQRMRTCDHPPHMHGGKACAGETTQTKACQLAMCPGNGTRPTPGDWAPWASWSNCSSQCGPGVQSRDRSCATSSPCQGLSRESQNCSSGSCSNAVDGVWELWAQWSSCTQSCGEGNQERTRQCRGPYYGGRECTGDRWQQHVCKLRECPVDASWDDWSLWSTCTLTCGNGTRSRTRSCRGPLYGGEECQGDGEQTERCSAFPCPVDGEWLSWGEWQPCNVTCGGGVQIRERSCKLPQYGGVTCTGATVEPRDCGHNLCPIDGVWRDWSEWSTCSVTCGYGVQIRERSCDGPYNGGAECQGSKNDSQACQPQLCPADSQWTDWETWSQCTVSCGGGSRMRIRECYNGQNGGKLCEGPASEVDTCQTMLCPVNGVWLSWSEWGLCTRTCGNGTRIRARTCEGPYNGGSNCTGAWEESESCNASPCAVDGLVQDWSAWSECSDTCGGGVRWRNRACYGPFHGGAACSEQLDQAEACNDLPCPVDGVFGDWGQWGACSDTCGGGSRSRERSCIGLMHGGSNCSGSWVQTDGCNDHNCPEDGVWSDWDTWSSCDVTCGGGVQWRRRVCDGPRYGGAECQGQTSQSRACSIQPCPVDGVFSDWGDWAPCDATCGGGLRWRSRHCLGPEYGGVDCQGSRLENSTCGALPCPVDGVWKDWSNWSTCTVTCGGGSQWRNRTCVGPFYGGIDCPSPGNESQLCNQQPCPGDGVWQAWTDWNQCSATCGGGVQQRERSCVGVSHGGKNCSGSGQESRTCSSQACPVDGVLTTWSDWSLCTITCGGGSQWRNRTCVGPYYGGNDCVDMRNESRDCNVQSCPENGYFLQWSDWGRCTVTCGGGAQHRKRTCVGPQYGGRACEGAAEEVQECNVLNCPVDGFYHQWSAWGLCSLTCGGGTQSRSRECQPPLDGGAECQGPAAGSQDCNTQPCPVNGVWNAWSSWSACNTTCGGGQRERLRTCNQPLYGGAPCQGQSAQYLPCADNPCPIPGDWLPWTRWSTCTVTCGGGTRFRSRACNMTSYGNLTAPCEGKSEEIDRCHTYNCTPVARTCAEWLDRGLTVSTLAHIDPDGTTGSLQPVQIHCDLDTVPGQAITVIGHDSEERTQVQGYEGACEYEHSITYNISFRHVLAVIDQSASCHQYIRWECKAALIHNPNDDNKITTGWLNRTQQLSDYFGNATPGSGSCTCGMTRNCTDPDLKCNCDVNDNIWRYDDGDISVKADLPVTSFVAGDTGGQNEDGYRTVGPVRCLGAA